MRGRHHIPLSLIGPRASGKTTVAAKSGGMVWDTDEILEKRFGSVSSLVAESGWDLFREYEADVLQESLGAAETFMKTAASDEFASQRKWIWPAVISTGGGIVLLKENRIALKERTVCVYLSVPDDILLERRLKAPMESRRPSLASNRQTEAGREELAEEITRIQAEREELYRECAHVVLDGALPMREILEGIAGIWTRYS